MRKTVLAFLLIALCIPLGGCIVTNKIGELFGEKITEKLVEGDTGANVDIDYDDDGGVGIETDDGEWTAGSKASIPDDFPPDVPVIDYHEIMSSSSFTDTGDGTKSFTLMVESKESLANTQSYYETEMSDEGWTNGSTFESNGTIMMSYTKDGNNCAVWIAENDGKVNVTLTVTIQI